MDDFKDLDEFIIEHVTRCVEDLKKHDHGQTYKSEVLCREFWADFKWEHNQIGRRIRWLEKNNRLPIVYVDRAPDNGALYRLK